jgi:hypothetical protein
MLPYYGVFDKVSYRGDGTKAALFGQITQPRLKDDAARSVNEIEGVPIQRGSPDPHHREEREHHNERRCGDGDGLVAFTGYEQPEGREVAAGLTGMP